MRSFLSYIPFPIALVYVIFSPHARIEFVVVFLPRRGKLTTLNPIALVGFLLFPYAIFFVITCPDRNYRVYVWHYAPFLYGILLAMPTG